jgi:hypothetical protein
MIHPVILPETVPQWDGQSNPRGNPMPDQPAIEEPLEGRVIDDDDVDIDLDEEDEHLREAIGEPVIVRWHREIFTVPHMMEWSHEHTRMVNTGDFDGWAQGVLSEHDYDVFKRANLQNYQLEKIVAKASRKAGTNPGKSSRSSGSRRRTGRR